MDKLLAIVGPTATGKTSLAINLGKRFSAEIVSADSRQIYKYMDIGTGKELPKNSKFKKNKNTIGYYKIDNVRVWLYDIVEPNQRFSAIEYAKLAKKVIADIWQRKKLPILTGGTGFYIKAILGNIKTSGIPPDWELRSKLQNLKLSELQKKLESLNRKKWELMNNSDRMNPRRLIRAIEVASFKTSKPQLKTEKLKEKSIIFQDILIIGLKTKLKILYQKIDRNVENRLKEGIIDEIKNLLKQGYSFDSAGMDALGYRQWRSYFSGKEDINQVVKKWKYAEHKYARRQLTYFNNKFNNIIWYDISRKDFTKQIIARVEKWYDF